MLDLRAERFETAARDGRRDRGAEQRFHRAEVERDFARLGFARLEVGDWRRLATARDFADQFGGANQRADLSRAIDAAFEAVARLAAQTQSARGARDGHRFEVCALEQDSRGRVADFGVETAHHAGDCERLVGVGDQQVVRIERAGDVVERDELARLAGAAHDDLALGDFRVIEGVQRLAEFEHDVVGRIDDVVERAHPAQFQPALEPRRRRTDLDSGHRERGVARAKIGRVDRNGDCESCAVGLRRLKALRAAAVRAIFRRTAPRPRAPGRESTGNRRDSA